MEIVSTETSFIDTIRIFRAVIINVKILLVDRNKPTTA